MSRTCSGFAIGDGEGMAPWQKRQEESGIEADAAGIWIVMSGTAMTAMSGMLLSFYDWRALGSILCHRTRGPPEHPKRCALCTGMENILDPRTQVKRVRAG